MAMGYGHGHEIRCIQQCPPSTDWNQPRISGRNAESEVHRSSSPRADEAAATAGGRGVLGNTVRRPSVAEAIGLSQRAPMTNSIVLARHQCCRKWICSSTEPCRKVVVTRNPCEVSFNANTRCAEPVQSCHGRGCLSPAFIGYSGICQRFSAETFRWMLWLG